ncbi:hypothetical protein BDN67DRAFT_791795 [Paxillus ammoniavirescens]|nr:hypothetical protein BDN67DRAFT_791795 [Paxillus ammoniavirescens]
MKWLRLNRSLEDIERQLHFYNGTLKLLPGLKLKLDTISPAKLTKVIQAITKGMSDGRSADLNSIKHKGLKYVPHDMHSKAEALDPSIPEVMDKSTRGIYHPMLARFMCPRTKLDQFDQDPELGMEDLQAGVITTKASRWPAGFYEHGVYSPGDKTKGLFRNHIVARFYQHLFIGPSSVMEQSTSRKSSKASKNRAWDLHCVDRYIIAYVHIMTYITLSHAPQWTQVIGEMDLSDLYWRIVEMLDDKTDPWVKETIGWWNRCA